MARYYQQVHSLGLLGFHGEVSLSAISQHGLGGQLEQSKPPNQVHRTQNAMLGDRHFGETTRLDV